MAKRIMTTEEATVKESFIAAATSKKLNLAKETAIPVQKMVRPLRGGNFEKAWTMWLKNENGGRLLGLMTSNGLKTIDNPSNYEFQAIK